MISFSENKSILVASHRRSGTHWTIDTIRHNFPEVNHEFLTLETLLPNHSNPVTVDEFMSHFQDSSNSKIIIKTHLAPFEVERIKDPTLKKVVQSVFNESKIVYVVRDGRDVLNSLFYYVNSFSQKDKQVTLTQFCKQKAATSKIFKGDGGNQLNRVEYWKLHVENWLSQYPNLHLLKYESLMHEFNSVVQKLENYLEIPSTPKIYKPELNSKGSSAVCPRKGIVGDYKHNFSREDLNYFEDLTGNFLKSLEYT
jgi:hypothetical protein